MRELDQAHKLYIKKEDVPKALQYYQQIWRYISKTTDVPWDLIQSFLFLLKDTWYEQQQAFLQQIDKASEAAFHRLQKENGYIFTWYRKDKNGIERDVNTELILSEVILAFFQFRKDEEEEKVKVTRSDTLRWFYDAFNDHYSNLLTIEDQKKFTQYKRKVYAGVLTISIGETFPNNPTPSNFDLQKICEDALSKRRVIKRKAK